MRITKEILENGVIIEPDGQIRKYQPGTKLKGKEMIVNLFPRGIEVIKYGSIEGANKKMKQVRVRKSRNQATMCALLTLFYFIHPSRYRF